MKIMYDCMCPICKGLGDYSVATWFDPLTRSPHTGNCTNCDTTGFIFHLYSSESVIKHLLERLEQ